MWQHIKRVGVEMEGGWDTRPTGGSMHGDGSVTVRANYTGEVVSRPMPEDEVVPFVTDNTPGHVNQSCGLHVHVSFNYAIEYMACMVEELNRKVVADLKAWGTRNEVAASHTFWARMNGDVFYCKSKFIPEIQVSMATKHASHEDGDARYAQLNFCHKLHGTIEFRLCAMFNRASLNVGQVQCLLKTVDEWITSVVGLPTGTEGGARGMWHALSRNRAGEITVLKALTSSAGIASYLRHKHNVLSPSSLHWKLSETRGDLNEYRCRFVEAQAATPAATTSELVTRNVAIIEELEGEGYIS